MKKLTFKYVKQYFEDHNCKLLETEYINNATKMKYECSCGNPDCEIRFGEFKQGNRCMECSGSKKYTFEEVKKYFEDHDCKLLAKEYKNNHTLMKYECNCGNDECEIAFYHFKSSQRCMECSESKKLIFEEVKKYFEDHDCKLLETEYKNNITPMSYECECENSDCKISFSNFKKGKRCKKCGIKKLRILQQTPFEEVKQYFEGHDCKLLETKYKNNRTLMKYECICGNFDCKITFNHFKSGKRCKECFLKRVSGENHWNYNSDLTDEERIIGRSYKEYIEWRKNIYERDNYSCIISEKIGGRLIAHHLESYGDNKELRLVMSNGITIGKKYHDFFHKIYGYGNNTTEQFNEFLENIKNKVIKID